MPTQESKLTAISRNRKVPVEALPLCMTSLTQRRSDGWLHALETQSLHVHTVQDTAVAVDGYRIA